MVRGPKEQGWMKHVREQMLKDKAVDASKWYPGRFTTDPKKISASYNWRPCGEPPSCSQHTPGPPPFRETAFQAEDETREEEQDSPRHYGAAVPLNVAFGFWDQTTPYAESDNTFCAELKHVVDGARAANRQSEKQQQEREDPDKLTAEEILNQVVDDLHQVCEDPEKMKALCMYYALYASVEGGLTEEMAQEIADQPWGATGKDAWEKYDRFIETVFLDPRVAMRLLDLLYHEKPYHLSQAKNFQGSTNKLGHLFHGANDKFFVKNARLPVRRPSQELDRGAGRRVSREIIPPDYVPPSPSRFSPESQTSPGKRGEDSGGFTRPHKFHSPTGRSRSPASDRDAGSQEGTPPKRPRSAESADSAESRAAGAKGAAKQKKPRKLQIENLVVRDPARRPFDKIKMDCCRLFLGRPSATKFPGLGPRLDHAVDVFRKFQTVVGSFHVEFEKCDSDDEGTGCNGRKCQITRPNPKCYERMHADMRDNFVGGYSATDYARLLQNPQIFILCFTRAVTKILNDYCLAMPNYNQAYPIFFPNYVETTLLNHVKSNPKPRDGESEHLARVLGIQPPQVERRLLNMRAKWVERYDPKGDIASPFLDDQSPEKKKTRRKYDATSGKGNYFTFPEDIKILMRRWLIDNGPKMTMTTRFPDKKTKDQWRDALKAAHPDFKKEMSDTLIHTYMRNYQYRNRKSFPLLFTTSEGPAHEEGTHPYVPPRGSIILSTETPPSKF